ncbi:M16 family metallopeptidase [Sphingomonas sp. PL20]|uniref:M16 family metallopeptidase n=2 Tax=Pseudomonadota TaxID=1224 RepID=UPI001AE80140
MRRLWVVAVAFAVTSVPYAVAQTPSWVAEERGETPDPAIHYGELANGLRYAVMRSAEPKGVAVVEYRIAVGTAQQAANEKEFAHLVEHMAFGATTPFPQGDAIAQLQSAGLQLGADVNGTTTARGTVYSLSIPQVTSEKLALALRFLRGFSDGALFDANEVERQKGVVGAEIAGGETQATRAARALRQQLYPELPYLWETPAQRLASLHTITADQLRAFHDRWYRPDTAFLVVVGDVDPAETGKALEAAFASWKRPSGPLPALKPVPFQPRTPSASVVQEAGLTDSLTLSVAKPQPDAVLTPATRHDTILATLGMAIVRDRLERLVLTTPQLPIASVSLQTSRWPELAEFYSLSANFRAGKWQEALALLEEETRRPLVTGFTVPEVDRAVTNTLKGARSASLRAAARTSAELANGIVGAYTDRQVFVLPERNFQRISEVLNAASPADIAAAYSAVWRETPPAIALAGAEALPASPTVVRDAYAVAHRGPLPARDLTLAVAKQLPLPGPAGKVVERHHVDDLGVDQVRFANGVRLNIKHTDFRANEVLTTMRVGGGVLALPHGERPVAPPLAMLYLGGVAGLNVEQLLAGLRATQVSIDSVALGTNVVQYRGQNNPASLSDQLRLWANLVGKPDFDPRADGLVQARVEAALEKADATAVAAFSRRWPAFSNSDSRFAPLDVADVSGLSFAQSRRRFGPILADAPIEVTIVGDIDVEKAIAATAETLGALPPRRSQPLRDTGPDPKFPTGGEPLVWTHHGDAGRALVVSAWRARDGFDPNDGIAQGVLDEILRNRLFNDLRQTSGATYSPAPLFAASTSVRGFGYVGAIVEVATSDVPLAERTLRTIASSLSELGPTAEELARVTAPMKARAALDARSNGWWLNALDWAQTQPDALARARGYQSALAALSVDQLKARAAEVFGTQPVTIRVMPGPAAKP